MLLSGLCNIFVLKCRFVGIGIHECALFILHHWMPRNSVVKARWIMFVILNGSLVNSVQVPEPHSSRRRTTHRRHRSPPKASKFASSLRVSRMEMGVIGQEKPLQRDWMVTVSSHPVPFSEQQSDQSPWLLTLRESKKYANTYGAKGLANNGWGACVPCLNQI